MTRIYVLPIAIGLFLSTSYLLVQSLPIKYHERNSRDTTPKQPRTQNNHLKKISNNRQIPQKWTEHKHAPGKEPPAPVEGWAMYPILADRVNHSIRGLNRIFPKYSKPTTAVHRSSGSSSSKSTESTEMETEMTISVPAYKTDVEGNFKFSWTFRSDENENLKPYRRGNPPLKLRAPAAQRRAYVKPDSTNYPVCFGSTIYNFPKQIRYLKPRIYNRMYQKRAVWLDLRMEIYKDAESQECHKANMTDWKKYIHCAIMRNMRMEYLVPKYPLHQQGAYFYLRNEFVDEFERYW